MLIFTWRATSTSRTYLCRGVTWNLCQDARNERPHMMIRWWVSLSIKSGQSEFTDDSGLVGGQFTRKVPSCLQSDLCFNFWVDQNVVTVKLIVASYLVSWSSSCRVQSSIITIMSPHHPAFNHQPCIVRCLPEITQSIALHSNFSIKIREIDQYQSRI